MADATYSPLVYRKQGGAEFVVASGGVINVEAGGSIAGAGVSLLTYTAASATPGTVRAVTGAAVTYATMTSGNLVGARGSITIPTGGAVSGTAYLYGVQGKAITGTGSFAGSALAGVYGQLDVSGGTITSGNVAAVQANIYGANSGSFAMDGIYVEHAGGGVINSLCKLFGKSTYVFDIASNVHNNVSLTGTVGTTAAKGWLKVFVDGSLRYIPLADAVS